MALAGGVFEKGADLKRSATSHGKHSMKFGFAAPLIVLALLAGCVAEQGRSGVAPAGAELRLLTVAPVPGDAEETINLTGRAEGRLVQGGSCVALRAKGGALVQLAWPAGTEIVKGAGGRPRIRNAGGGIDLQLGDHVILGGGSGAPEGGVGLQAPVPPDCRGEIFVVSGARVR